MRQSAKLDAKRAEFSALYLADANDPLALQLASVMEKECPEIKLLVQPTPETDTPVHALLLPEDAALTGGEKLGAWIREFGGSKFIIPSAASAWIWVREPELIAKSLRQLAEGEKIQLEKKSPGWMIAVYILAGLMLFEILFVLVMSTLDALGVL